MDLCEFGGQTQGRVQVVGLPQVYPPLTFTMKGFRKHKASKRAGASTTARSCRCGSLQLGGLLSTASSLLCLCPLTATGARWGRRLSRNGQGMYHSAPCASFTGPELLHVFTRFLYLFRSDADVSFSILKGDYTLTLQGKV